MPSLSRSWFQDGKNLRQAGLWECVYAGRKERLYSLETTAVGRVPLNSVGARSRRQGSQQCGQCGEHCTVLAERWTSGCVYGNFPLWKEYGVRCGSSGNLLFRHFHEGRIRPGRCFRAERQIGEPYFVAERLDSPYGISLSGRVRRWGCRAVYFCKERTAIYP